MDKNKILTKALENIDRIVQHLFPAAVKRQNRFYIGNIQGEEGKSLTIEAVGPKAGYWHDFATSEGGDILSLWAAVKKYDINNDFAVVLDSLASFLGMAQQNFKKEPDSSWVYYDMDGKALVKVLRYNTATGKIFYPYDYISHNYKFPEIRPLFNLPLIKKSEKVIIVEGEKCAESITAQGFCGTTALGGANTLIEKTDWTPLKDKEVLIWPDNDEPGQRYALKVYEKLISLGIQASILELPANKPPKWDCADAANENFDISNYITSSRKLRPEVRKNELIIKDWNITRYSTKPKPTEFLVDEIFPLGVVSMLAAVGDTGKSMLILDLALKITTGMTGVCFGHRVMQQGAVVLFLAEDDQNEVERRLCKLDPQGTRFLYPDRFYILPLPNISGSFPIVEEKPNEIKESAVFQQIKQQIMEIDNIKLIVFDPLSSFINGDITFNSSVSAFLMNSLAQLAVQTKATVIITHHLRKTGGEINGVDDVREAIRGSSALVNGVRLAYAFWPLKILKQKEYFRGKEFIPNALFYGAVVKANNKVDREIKTYLRNQNNGLLEVISENKNVLNKIAVNEDILLSDIARLNKSNERITYSGRDGVFEKRNLLSVQLQKLSKRNIRAVVSSLLSCNKVTKEADGNLKVVLIPENEVEHGQGSLPL
ncbi:MAG: AAA family ATPase [Pseudomonadota bacterium]|nr:AAA family ATPase [Pseudomonadota bacterium]